MTTIAAPERSIKYDRETKDFALCLNGEIVGYARSYSEGEQTLDELVFDRLQAAQVAHQGDTVLVEVNVTEAA